MISQLDENKSLRNKLVKRYDDKYYWYENVLVTYLSKIWCIYQISMGKKGLK